MKLEVVQIFIDYQVGEKKKKHPILQKVKSGN